MTPLHSQILLALKLAEPRPLTDCAIWMSTGGYEIGGHLMHVIAACFDLEEQGLIEAAPEKAWKLTQKGREAVAA